MCGLHNTILYHYTLNCDKGNDNYVIICTSKINKSRAINKSQVKFHVSKLVIRKYGTAQLKLDYTLRSNVFSTP